MDIITLLTGGKKTMDESLYIIRVPDNNEFFDYEYGNIEHANEHYNTEKTASLLEYKDGNHYLIKSK